MTGYVSRVRSLLAGITDLCPEHLRQSIRHVQRNCDIECNVHTTGPDWEDCKQPDRAAGERMALALASITHLLARLDAVEALAAIWEASGESDMAASRTAGDEHIAMVLLTEGAAMVENARLIRNALRGEGEA